MSKIVIGSAAEWEKLQGTELGVSSWITVSQEKINKFAEATDDYQWIHIDVEKAKTESPFKQTIAHGYLSLSLIPALIPQIIETPCIKLAVNYAVENLRFSEPVPAGGQVRLRLGVNEVKNLRGIIRVKFDVCLELKDSPKSVFKGTMVYLYHY